MPHALIDSLDKAVENIVRYQTEVQNRRLAERMKQVHAWYAIMAKDRTWIFAPSKFIGYADNTADAYLTEARERDGGRTEAILRQWFDVPAQRLAMELQGALRNFLASHGHSGPRENARILIPREFVARAADRIVPELLDRIHVDPAICGGRPHIRGTRVRVADVLDMLANGVTRAEVLADYPYLGEADLNAALAYGAAASAHRVILAA